MEEYNSSFSGAEIDAAVNAVKQKETSWDEKQAKLTGQQGQVVGFDADGRAEAQSLSGGGVPKGTIVIWSGTESDIPDGWALCDGQDGRPDLRDKFVLGAGSSHAAGTSGGAETVTLTVGQIPSHNHKVSTPGAIPNNTLQTIIPVSGILDSSTEFYQANATVPTGGSQPHDNMPPYYALCYIIKVSESGGGSGESNVSESLTAVILYGAPPNVEQLYVLRVNGSSSGNDVLWNRDPSVGETFTAVWRTTSTRTIYITFGVVDYINGSKSMYRISIQKVSQITFDVEKPNYEKFGQFVLNGPIDSSALPGITYINNFRSSIEITIVKDKDLDGNIQSYSFLSLPQHVALHVEEPGEINLTANAVILNIYVYQNFANFDNVEHYATCGLCTTMHIYKSDGTSNAFPVQIISEFTGSNSMRLLVYVPPYWGTTQSVEVPAGSYIVIA